MTRRACAIDANQREIVAALLRMGWDVIDAHAFAQTCPGFPDLICARGETIYFVEVKMPGEDLTEREATFWRVHPNLPLRLVRMVEDIVALSGGRMM